MLSAALLLLFGFSIGFPIGGRLSQIESDQLRWFAYIGCSILVNVLFTIGFNIILSSNQASAVTFSGYLFGLIISVQARLSRVKSNQKVTPSDNLKLETITSEKICPKTNNSNTRHHNTTYETETVSEVQTNDAKTNISNTQHHNMAHETETVSDVQSDDAELYLQAQKELENNKQSKALWVKVMTLCDGDEVKAKYRYISIRVEEQKRAISAKIKADAEIMAKVAAKAVADAEAKAKVALHAKVAAKAKVIKKEWEKQNQRKLEDQQQHEAKIALKKWDSN